MKGQPKLCSCCNRPAEFSLSFLISTLRVKDRKQQCSQSVPLCRSCIHDFCDSEASESAAKLREALRNAYTAIKLAFSETIQDKNASER